jgi:murein DD-endopeptidase MepM/ murein hydrolase activator NlpD
VKKFHEGVDLPQPYGTPVFASRPGRVIFADWREGYGNLVIIKHRDRSTSRYGHLSVIGVKPGQWAEPGRRLLGRVGNSGLSTGPHLHFEIRDRYGRPLNPRKQIR